ncbi:cytochrome cL apoprotein [Paracoccus alcaliphilus]|uniref:Cytochrome c-L n=1 Tax=Paracoccus alcaliphilus TaxID=34002 RepID=A0A1H8E2V5_9RHOB|nr:cytochrome c(L), periplasmic [Paracoccus alcaliphilus]WCR16833.1 cytochrome c(L), periplasmic [Paracoccus alcaliphilus]SEN13098.1 cytochrome cL apoprotein [Paracoccus alcaliphilus]
MKQIVLAGIMAGLTATAAVAQPQFYHAVEGTPLNFDDALEEGRDTEAVQEFMETGMNPYNEDPEHLPEGESLFNTMCSGCHGHYAEGKIGPGLNDDFWSYQQGLTDEGLFSIVFGGTTGQMGPMYGSLTLDEMLLVMSWVRHLYTGEASTASWLTPEQRENFTPFKPKGGGEAEAEEQS